MSLLKIVNVTCPRCGISCPVTIWKTINMTIDPALRQRVLDNTLQATTCSQCKHEFNVTSDFIYHDMDRKFMLSLIRSDSGRAFTVPDSLLQAAGLAMASYRLRFVTSYKQLLEKIRIFEADLSDFAIELLKMIVWSQKFPEKPITDDSMYFCVVENNGSSEATMLFELYEHSQPFARQNVPFTMYATGTQRTSVQIKTYRLGEWILVNQTHLRQL